MSTIQATNIGDGVGSIASATIIDATMKAWAQYNQGPATTVDSLNVTSITDAAVGDYDVTYTNNFASATTGGRLASSEQDEIQVIDQAADGHGATTRNSTGSAGDTNSTTGRIGDLA